MSEQEQFCSSLWDGTLILGTNCTGTGWWWSLRRLKNRTCTERDNAMTGIRQRKGGAARVGTCRNIRGKVQCLCCFLEVSNHLDVILWLSENLTMWLILKPKYVSQSAPNVKVPVVVYLYSVNNLFQSFAII